jgi:hypothetical protein
MRIRINLSIVTTTSALTHSGDPWIPLLDFFNGHEPSNHQGIGRRNFFLIGSVGYAFCSIRNGKWCFILFRRSGDGRSVRGSVIFAGGVGVFQATILVEHRGFLSTVTQFLTHGLHLSFQYLYPFPQLLLSMVGFIELNSMTVETLLELVHSMVDILVPFHATVDQSLHSTSHVFFDGGNPCLLLPPLLGHSAHLMELPLQSIGLNK